MNHQSCVISEDTIKRFVSYFSFGFCFKVPKTKPEEFPWPDLQIIWCRIRCGEIKSIVLSDNNTQMLSAGGAMRNPWRFILACQGCQNRGFERNPANGACEVRTV